MRDNLSDFENHDFIIHIYNEYGRLMYYIAHQMLPDRQQCEDVIQESLTNLIAKVDILKTLTKPKLTNYIVVTVRHTAINASCRQNREKRYTEPLSETSEDFLPTSPSSIDILLRNERIEDLRKAMKVLRPDEQRLLEGKYFLGYDDNRLSEICECSPGSVRMKLTRARRKILNIMEREVEMHDKA
jgi:RNA polymerase sigma-70 factor (ECF subfamily)